MTTEVDSASDGEPLPGNQQTHLPTRGAFPGRPVAIRLDKCVGSTYGVSAARSGMSSHWS